MRLRLCLVSLLVAALSAVSLAGQKVVLGKLGQATGETPIRSSASPRGRVFYKVKQFEYLVIRDSSRKGWKRVLMQNGSYGYISEDAVAVLPYEVTADAPTAPAAPSRRSGRTLLASRSTGAALARYSTNFIGTKYQWGGNDLKGGIDCSGFVKELFQEAGVNLPRTAAQQVNVGKHINRLEDLQPGDRLYFWDYKRNLIGHTGIYYGDGYFVHSSSNRKGVAVDTLRNPKWRNLLVAARR